MKKVTLVCDLKVTDDFNEKDIKDMLDASPHIREASMQCKIEQEGEDDGLQHPNRRW
jgi:hypothetical protein